MGAPSISHHVHALYIDAAPYDVVCDPLQWHPQQRDQSVNDVSNV
ncbi:hypothetical protein NBRC3293_0593 [Gluconobacter oxydans NBRC 3293]|uniref:Uncharacterized protein n=1 Tax=Gluconobacter oxydans NBRC 3293 TaxID=1315969 RepID=A0A829X6E3_GLUOY|nr:hypothetical protein NBRC3293_0593 [Gluconobacter oxydans NBRC 3293]